MEFYGKRWKYIDEGNVHIVLQILDTNYVLRLIKHDNETVDFEHVCNSVNFVNSVMIPLLGNDFDAKEETLQISEEELVKLSRSLYALRPEHRRFKSVISPYAIKAPNLSTVSPKCNLNYCIEIKPKEGFISKGLRKYSKCYYCLKQYLKLRSKHIVSQSKYCPLDLFSGDKDRMKLAILNLADNPQNNFKLFKNGSLIYNEKCDRKDFNDIIKTLPYFETTAMFIEFIKEALLGHNKDTDFMLKDCSDTPVTQTSDKCIEKNNLKPNTFLYRLLQLQKLSETCRFDATNINQHKEYVSTILNQLKADNLNLSVENDRIMFMKTIDPIHLALISAVAKDCSIMISFSPDFDENFPYIQVKYYKLSYKVSVTDLEPKSVQSLAKRKDTEREMTEIYQKCIGLTAKQLKGKIQPHTETRAKQLEAWQQLIAEYLKATKQSTIDIRESQNSPLFNNTGINRKLSQEAVLIILEDMAKTGRAAPIDKSKNVWEVYWHSLDEWGNMIYNWACDHGMNNTVCTLFELREGENTTDQEFHGLDMNILIKALKSLEIKGRCELIEFDDHQGVKFF